MSKEAEEAQSMRLNKYLSNSGLATRRGADDLIKKGLVKVNGKVVREMGYKVSRADKVQYKDDLLKWPEKLVYILMNKAKDTITSEESETHKTAVQFLQNIDAKNLFAVDEMQASDLGLLLICNDELLANKLRNPEAKLRKIYLLELDKDLTEEDLSALKSGIEVEGITTKAEEIAFTQEDDRKQIGLEIWDNRKDIVQQLFEKLGYQLLKIDRTIYGNLSKKDLPRGKWRFVDDKELRTLKRFIS